jgi:predicted ATPase/DNA-binding SARP family transcriptional activator
VRVRVLGGLEVRDGLGAWRPVASRPQRRALAVLAAHLGEPVPADVLVDAMWDGAPPLSAAAALRTHLAHLRLLLGDALVTAGGRHRLALGPDDVDAGRFTALVRAAVDQPAPVACDLLEAALDLWRGPAFGSEASIAAVRAEAAHLERQRTAASEALAAALLGAGRVAEAEVVAEGLLAGDPGSEGAWLVLVEALGRSGRAAEALRAVQRATGALADAGLVPSAALRAVEQAVLDGELVPTPLPGDGTVAGIAVPMAPLVGRDGDVRAAVDLLDEARLVSLVGPGGVGTTRLALEVARRAARRRRLGAVLVELGRLPAGADVLPVVAGALGLAPRPDPAAVLARAGALDLLVVLDGADRTAPGAGGAAEAVRLLLAGGPAVRVLTTSRERLRVDGEHVRRVRPLGTEPGGPAAQLLVARARAAVPGTALAAGDEVVARIARRVDGVPLALEVVAAHLAATGVADLAAELEADPRRGTSSRRRGPPRHRSIADTLAWAEGRLDGRQRAALTDLAVFAAPVCAADVEEVLEQPDAGEVVRSLAERSLVAGDRATPVRFRLPDVVRAAALVRLAASGRRRRLEERHARWCLRVATEADAQLRGSDEDLGHRRLGAALPELRAAHAWARRHRPELAAELSARLHLHATTRHLDEPLAWAEDLLAVVGEDHPRRPALLASSASRRLLHGRVDEAAALAADALALGPVGAARLPALDVAARAALEAGRLVDAGALARELAATADAVGDLHHAAVARALAALVTARGAPGERAGSPGYVGEVLTRLDEVAVEPLGASGRGWLAYARGEVLAVVDPDAAAALLGEAVAAARTAGHRGLEDAALRSTGALHGRVPAAGEVAAATAFAEVIGHWQRVGDDQGQLAALRDLLGFLVRRGAAEAVAELAGALQRNDGTPLDGGDERVRRAAGWAAAELGGPRAEALATRGAELDVDAAASRALQVLDANWQDHPS